MKEPIKLLRNILCSYEQKDNEFLSTFQNKILQREFFKVLDALKLGTTNRSKLRGDKTQFE